MPRTIPSGTQTEVAKKLGTEPILIIEIDWPPTRSYADRDFDSIPGKILEVGNLDAVIQAASQGSTASLAITLSDADGSILAILNSRDVHKVKARVYQTYGGLTASDKFLLFSGELNSPILWNERARTFSCEIVSKFDSREVGFSPEEGQFEFIAEEAVGRAWPLCFGSPVRVPAVKITGRIRGNSLTQYGLISIGNLNSLESAVKKLVDAETLKTAADSNPGYSDENYEAVINQLTVARMALDSLLTELIEGSPSQEPTLKQFVALVRQLREAEVEKEDILAAIDLVDESIKDAEGALEALAIQIDQYPDMGITPDLEATYADTEAKLLLDQFSYDQFIFELETVNSSIEGFEAAKDALTRTLTQFVLEEIVVEGGEDFPQNQDVTIVVNSLRLRGRFNDRVFSIAQVLPTVENVAITPVEGVENQFDIPVGIDLRGLYAWIPGEGIIHIDEQNNERCSYSPLLYSYQGTLSEVFNILINGEPVNREVYDYYSPVNIQAASPIIFQSWIDNVRNAKPDFANGIDNAQQYDWSLSYGDEVYLDGDFTDTYIANLIPSTQVHEVVGKRIINGEEKIVPIPSQYYTVTLDESIAGQNATTIRFIRPLASFQDQQWTGEVYVSLTSSVGPNTADIIQYLAQTYTDLGIDATSFASVKAAIANYPSHFAILDRPDAVSVISQIAWQARCASFIKNQVLYLKYLAAEPSADQSLTEENISNLVMTFSQTEDLVTKLNATWKHDLSIERANRIILRNNVPKYGLFEKDFDFFIYNIKSLVIKSATFWLIRMSNTWKRLTFTGYLDTLKLEVMDTVELSWPENVFSEAAVKALVQEADYNSVDASIAYTVELPIRSGEQSVYPFYWSGSAPVDLEYPTEDDLYAGGG